jgi:hypothetical protein
VIERGGKAICRIVPAGPRVCTVGELEAVLKSSPRPDRGYLEELEQLSRQQPALPADPWAR